MSPSAVEKLQPSRLSDQREGLGADVDLSQLSLALRSKASLPILEMLTGGEIERTIEGASTLTLELIDRDRVVRTSGLLGAKVSVKLDGLWFRLVSVAQQGTGMTLTFEDREVNVLRDWPPKNKPKTWARLNTPESLGGQKVARARFAQLLIRDVAHVLAIRFVCPVLKGAKPLTKAADRPDPAVVTYKPGLLATSKITVKGPEATPEQVKNIERVLDVGTSMGASRDVLVMAVMTVTQESGVINLTGGDRDSVGLFQQRRSGGRPDGGSWPASRDIETDAHAFFEVAIWVEQRIKTGVLPPLSLGGMCTEVQRDGTWHTSRAGADYAQWQTEATRTVAIYLGDTVLDPVPVKPGGTATPPAVPPFTDTAPDDTAHMFTRGQRTTINGKKTWKREDNWTCLQRLAEEVRWRCFCVSGTVSFVSETDLFKAKPAMTLTERSDGVTSIDGRYDVGQHNAQVTVNCRADRWQAPPGTVVILAETGLFDGRWLVANIRRGIFNRAATITLKKPRPVLPEGQSPEYGAGQTSGTVTYQPPGGQQQPPVASVAGYRDPFRKVTVLVNARIDQGVDYASPSRDPIYAIGNGKINYFARDSGWPGGVFIAYTLTDGPAQGLSVFVAEYVTPSQDWQPGDGVNSDTILAYFVPGTDFSGNGIETGWSTPGASQTMAHDVYNSGHATAFGANFSEFLTSLNGRNAGRYDHPEDKGHELGSLPDLWPRWKP